ncbi:hypothetical protein B0H13DRAFT_1894136 [Mycena leptocephala]|nr:hypothetical protein B0H13DRAFT_1894136 [Mycena leptocephala]
MRGVGKSPIGPADLRTNAKSESESWEVLAAGLVHWSKFKEMTSSEPWRRTAGRAGRVQQTISLRRIGVCVAPTSIQAVVVVLVSVAAALPPFPVVAASSRESGRTPTRAKAYRDRSDHRDGGGVVMSQRRGGVAVQRLKRSPLQVGALGRGLFLGHPFQLRYSNAHVMDPENIQRGKSRIFNAWEGATGPLKQFYCTSTLQYMVQYRVELRMNEIHFTDLNLGSLADEQKRKTQHFGNFPTPAISP